MAFIPIPNAIEVAVHWTFQGQDYVLTIGIKVPSAVTQTILDAASAALDLWSYTELRPRMTAGYAHNYVKAVDQTTSSGPISINTAHNGAGGSSTATGAVLPGNVALVVTFHTALRGRSFRGRNYTFGLASGNLATPLEVASGSGTAIGTVYANLNSYMTGFSGVHSVLSRYSGNAPRVTGLATPVTAYAVSLALDSQRRRLLGRGT